VSAATAGPRDDGFTLIELLLATTLMVVVTGALAASLITVFLHQGHTTARMNFSHNANMFETYFAQDVSSATAAPVPSTAFGCSSPNGVGLSWTESVPTPSGVAATTAFAVSYGIASGPAGSSTYVVNRTSTVGTATPIVSTVAHDLTDPCGLVVTVAGSAVGVTVNQGSGVDAYQFSLSGTAGARLLP
jgi:prepilin-type N-terminal cleavage/methylation domain-containing protein